MRDHFAGSMITVAIAAEDTPAAVNFLWPARVRRNSAQNKGGGAFRHRRPLLELSAS